MSAERDYPPIADLEDYVAETELLQEIQQLLDLQYSRYGQSRVVWQLVTGNENVWPDLGRLLQWLMERLDYSRLVVELHMQRGHGEALGDYANCSCADDITRVLAKGE